MAATMTETMRRRARSATRRAVTMGLVGGGVLVYLSATGIAERFHERNIITGPDATGLLHMSRTMLGLVLLIIGFAAARRKADEVEGGLSGVQRGLLSGALAGGVLAGFVLLMRFFTGLGWNPREILVSVSPHLLNDVLGFGLSLPMKLVTLVAGGAAIAGLGGAAHNMSERVRRPIMTAFLATLAVSLFEPLLRPMLGGLGLNVGWLYLRGGLTLLGTAVVFLGTAGTMIAWNRRGQGVRARIQELPDERRKALRTVALIAGLVFLAVLPHLVGRFVSDVLGIVGLYVLLGLGLNIVVGFAGLLDLGYVAFFAVGAYAMAIFTSRASFLVVDTGLGVAQLQYADAAWTNFWVALPLTVGLAMISGVLIGAPVLRLRGDYLAIVTLGFGEIIRVLVASNWLAKWLGGAQGVIQIAPIPVGGLNMRSPQNIYYLILAFCILAAFVSYRLAESRIGRAWAAMREDESVAEAMGISVIKYKMLAFVMGAAVGCLGGAFFSSKIGSIFPNSFDLQVSINALAVIVLGGMGSIPGVIIGALVLVGLPEFLREFAEYRLLFYGGILVAIMVFKPEGLLPNVRRRRELHIQEMEEEQFDKRAGEGPPPVVTTDGGEEE